mgnify:CR=1 FL=1
MKNLYNFIFAITYRDTNGKFAPTEYRRVTNMTIGNARVYRSRIYNMQNVIECVMYKEIY